MDKFIEEIINRLSVKKNKPKEVIKAIIWSEFEFTREEIKKIDLDKINELSDLDDMKATFNYIGLGKLHPSIKKIKAIRKHIDINKKK